MGYATIHVAVPRWSEALNECMSWGPILYPGPLWNSRSGSGALSTVGGQYLSSDKHVTIDLSQAVMLISVMFFLSSTSSSLKVLSV